jgi:hypothetical protein
VTDRQDRNEPQLDPGQDALRDRVRFWVDVLKHFSTLSGATAVGVAALQESLELNPFGAVVSLVALGVSFLAAVGGMFLITPAVGGPDRYRSRSEDYYLVRAFWYSGVSGVLLIGGVFIFMISSLVAR